MAYSQCLLMYEMPCVEKEKQSLSNVSWRNSNKISVIAE